MISPAQPGVRVFPDAESLSRAAADVFIAAAAKTAANARFSVALSGGSTPRRLYELLGSSPRREAVPWPRVHVFWADERCVPPDHPESNYKLAFDTFLSKVPLPDGHIHRIRGEDEQDAAVRSYERELAAFFRGRLPAFDLLLLGAGADGHTASLFPGSPQVREKKRQVLPVPARPAARARITLTLPVLNSASDVIILATGRSKAAIVHEIIEDGNPKQYPAGLIRPHSGSLTWMLDREAAAALTEIPAQQAG